MTTEPHGTRRIQIFLSTTYDVPPDTSEIESVASAPLQKLTSRGVYREKLLAWVSVILIASRQPLYSADDWAFGSGHSARSLRELPIRVGKWADEIQQVNECSFNGIPLLDPRRFVAEEWSTNVLGALFPDYQASSLPSMHVILRSLPDLLRAHGVYLEAQISEIFRQNADLQRVPTFEHDFSALLCEFVRESTGANYCYEDLADLLSIAYQVDNQDRITSAGALRMNRQHYTTSTRTPKVLGFELKESERILRVLVEIEEPAVPA